MDLVTFTEEILNGKLWFFCSDLDDATVFLPENVQEFTLAFLLLN